MASGLVQNAHRMQGPTHHLKFAQRPHCIHCGAEMVIRHSSKPRNLIDLAHNAHYTIYYYRCNVKGCAGMKEAYLRTENPHCPPKSEYSYAVYAKICYLRWNKRRTYLEIVEDMQSYYNITLSINTVEYALKIYEFGCADKYREKYVSIVQRNGGVILTIDGMAPMKGNKSLYVAFDYLSGLTLGSWRIPNQKADTIEIFLTGIKERVERELGVKITGIISDALPSQRIAIERVFPDVPHCLCHYHFYQLVLLNAKQVDSHIMSQIRKKIRSLRTMKNFLHKNTHIPALIPASHFFKEVLEVLKALSNWKRSPKDPCFSGLILFERFFDVYSAVQRAVLELDRGIITTDDEKDIRCLYTGLSEIIGEHQEKAKELAKIQDHLSNLSSILSDLDTSYNVGLKRLRAYRDKLRKYRFSPHCGEIEHGFIEELMKYIRTKGEQLINYKKVEGAPTTNNRHELKFKQLKHFLRRAIGFASAKRYLLSHGEHIVYVQMDESYEEILNILHSTDFLIARGLIAQERRPRNTITHKMHQRVKWSSVISKLLERLTELRDPLKIIN